MTGPARFSRVEIVWLIVGIGSAAVCVLSLCLAIFAGTNWFTPVGAACTTAAAIGVGRALRRQRRDAADVNEAARAPEG